jgi:DNA-binding NtrC family response regulator
MKEIGRAAQAAAERIAIEDEQGNLPRAARRLGISDRALQMRRASYRKPPAADSATA